MMIHSPNTRTRSNSEYTDNDDPAKRQEEGEGGTFEYDDDDEADDNNHIASVDMMRSPTNQNSGRRYWKCALLFVAVAAAPFLIAIGATPFIARSFRINEEQSSSASLQGEEDASSSSVETAAEETTASTETANAPASITQQLTPTSTAPTNTAYPTTKRTSTETAKAPASNTQQLPPSPTSAPPTNTASPTTKPTEYNHVTRKGCLPDRFDNDQMDLTVDPSVNFGRLYPGQFICSKPYSKRDNSDKVSQRYRFGLTEDSLEVVWEDTVTGETIVVMERPIHATATDNSVYFTLTTDATMIYHYQDTTNSTTATVEKPTAVNGLNHPMQLTPSRCLSNHDCPYFHLHSEGVMVLNYIAADGTGWEARNFKRAYGI